MDDERRWEELNVDCLINIFKRVGMESLLMDVPFVCKPWHQASLQPSCWESLIFPQLYYPYYDDEDCYPYTCFDRFRNEYKFDGIHVSFTAFVKFVIDRSKGRTTCLELSNLLLGDLEGALKYAADQYPDLKALSLLNNLIYSEGESLRSIWNLIGNWKHLESLVLRGSDEMEIFLAADCKLSLRVLHVENASIGIQEAEAIVTFLPELKELILRGANIDRDEIVTLLQGCKELVHLDVSACEGFDGEDEEIAKLASHIANFTSEGSKISEPEYDYIESGGDFDQFGGYYSS